MKARFEKVVPHEGRLFMAFEYWTSRIRAPYHFHPEVELAAIIRGDGHRIIGDAIEPFTSGDLVLIGANLPHQYSASGASSGKHKRQGSAAIQFLPEALGTAFLQSADGAPVKQLLEHAARGLFFTGPVAKQIIARMRTIVATTGPARFTMLIEALDTLARCDHAAPLASYAFTPDLNSRVASRIARACSFIQERFEQDITQADAAAHVSLSPPAFSRMFRTATRLTFTAFLTGVRVSEACRRLLETDDSVAQIAFACGFNNLSNFNRRFLAAKACTPREYRRASVD